MKRLAGILLFSLSLMTYGQSGTQGDDAIRIDLPGGPVTIKDVLTAVENATGLGVYYLRGTLDPGKQVMTRRGKLPYRNVLDLLLGGEKLQYFLEGSNIFIRRSVGNLHDTEGYYFEVTVIDEDHQPLPGVTLQLQSSGKRFVTGDDGTVLLRTWNFPDTLLCFAVGRQPVATTLTKNAIVRIKMHPRETLLSTIEVKVTPGEYGGIAGYGEYSMNKVHLAREISSIDRRQLAEQPASDLVAALTGRISGLLVTRSSGVLGSSSEISIRGRSSILNGRSPLFIIDGVPFAPGNQSVSNIPGGNAAGSLSPLSFLALDNIERISILRDADATAVYGSRGANGVVLITTRQGTPDKPSLSFIASTGYSRVTRRPLLMDTRQYIDMRKEALRNDGLTPEARNAPDLTQWDTTRNIDYGQFLIGRPASIVNMGMSVTGGSASKNYHLGFDHLNEADAFPTHPAHNLFTAAGNFNYRSRDERMSFKANGLYGGDDNRQYVSDVTGYQYLIPGAPALISADGRIVFNVNGVSFKNPLAFIGRPYEARSQNTLAAIDIDYRMKPGLSIRNKFGYNRVGVREFSMIPRWTQDPATNASDSINFAASAYTSWIWRSMLDYQRKMKDWHVNVLTGASWEGRNSNVSTRSAVELFDTRAIAGFYESFFMSLTLDWKEKYLLHLTGRTDGTTRWRKSYQYGSFGSASLAWTFSKEPSFRRLLPFVDLARLKVSCGLTGNDDVGIGDRNAQTDIPWERVVKREAVLEAGMFHERLTFSATRYHNHSLNQLLPMALPAGGNPVVYNSHPIVVQNSGWEFNFTASVVNEKRFKWSAAINLSFPVNKLAAFPGLDATPFKNLAAGRSLTSLRGFRYLGVDQQTGIFQFRDIDGDHRLTDKDKEMIGNLDAVIFGGAMNSFACGPWRLSVLVEARIQQGLNYQTAFYAINPPGSLLSGAYSNQTIDLNNHWHRPGDKSTYQRLTTTMNSPAGQAIDNYRTSSALLTNASFARLKSMQLSYQLPESWMLRMKLRECKFFLQGEDLFTVTPYRMVDPEIQSMLILPPSARIMMGLQIRL